MSRRPQKTVSVSLFPFLSVLVCLIGVLVFMGIAVAQTSITQAQKNIMLEIQSSERDDTGKPLLIEVLADHAIVLEKGLRLAVELDEADVADDAPAPAAAPVPETKLEDWLATFHRDFPNRYVLYLVRPAGVAAFQDLRWRHHQYNRDREMTYVEVGEEASAVALEALPAALRERLTTDALAGGRFGCDRPLNAEELAQVLALYRTFESHRLIEELNTRLVNQPGYVDYGYELIPEAWEVKGTQTAEVAP